MGARKSPLLIVLELRLSNRFYYLKLLGRSLIFLFILPAFFFCFDIITAYTY